MVRCSGLGRRAFSRGTGSVIAAEAAPAASPRGNTGSNVNCGPHTGQANGWAWKRRSSGERYSLRQSAHSGKPAIEVLGRSYGMALMMV